MVVVGTPHWLERAIQAERDPATIAKAIAADPKFLEVIRDSVEFARTSQQGDPTRLIAEHIVYLMHFEFTSWSMHNKPGL